MLDRSRFDVGFACLRRWGPFVEELHQLGIPLEEYQISTFRSVHALTQQARLARQITRERIDIVHAYNFYGNVFAIPPARLAAPRRHRVDSRPLAVSDADAEARAALFVSVRRLHSRECRRREGLADDGRGL